MRGFVGATWSGLRNNGSKQIAFTGCSISPEQATPDVHLFLTEAILAMLETR